MKINFKDVITNDGRGWDNISLSKLTGQHIKDVECYLSTEFGEPTLVVTNITLGNGDKIHMGGEHDMPYIEATDKKYNLDDETLESLWKQDPDNEDDEDDE